MQGIKRSDKMATSDMPNYTSYEWDDFKVFVRPSGFRGLIYWLLGGKIKFNIPYFTGSDVDILLNIKTKSGEQREFAYTWACLYAQPNGYVDTINSNTITFLGNPTKKVRSRLKIPCLRYKGLYDIQIDIVYPIDKSKQSPSVTVVDFYASDRDALTINLLFALVGILGVVIGVLISWLLT